MAHATERGTCGAFRYLQEVSVAGQEWVKVVHMLVRRREAGLPRMLGAMAGMCSILSIVGSQKGF